MSSKIDNPLVIPNALSFLTYRRVEGGGKRPERVSAGPVAGQYCAALLQLPHHGGTGDDVHRDHGGGGVPAVARKAVRRALDAVDPAACAAVPLHREHRGMDDGGDRTPALAGVRADAHRGRLLEDGLRGQRHVHAAGVHGHVHGAGDPVPVSGAPRDRARAGRRLPTLRTSTKTGDRRHGA